MGGSPVPGLLLFSISVEILALIQTFLRWLEFFQSVEYAVNLAVVYSIQSL